MLDLSRRLTKAYTTRRSQENTIRTNGSPSTEKVLDSFFFLASGPRATRLATMHKIFLEGNKCSLCGIAKLCNSLLIESRDRDKHPLHTRIKDKESMLGETERGRERERDRREGH